MNTQPQTDLNRVLEIISEIEKISASGNYIYRGEPKYYKKVSSNLYRKLEEIKVEHPEKVVEKIQEAELGEAKNYTNETNELEILTQIQHFGGKTNLIDFTTDYNIALFFACDGILDEPGRVILQNKTGAIKDWIKEPRNPDPGSRPDVQKSIFIRPPNGLIEPDKTVDIPKDLKRILLKYLEREFNISIEKIYYDFHGFIRSQDIRWDTYTEYSKGIIFQEGGTGVENSQEKDKNYQKAIKHFTKAIELRPDYAEIYNNRGVAYERKGEIDRAIVDYNTVIELRPDHAEAYNNRGLVYSDKDEHDRAIVDFDKAIQLDPQLTEAYNNRGAAYCDKNKYDCAIDDFNKAIELNPDYVSAYNNRGVAYRDKSDYDRAIVDFDKATKLNPQNASSYGNRGVAYHKRGEIDRAIEDYDKALKLKPDFAEAYNSRGIAYRDKDEVDRALEDHNKAIQLDSHLVEAYNSRGIAYCYKGEYDRAIVDINKAIKLKPNYAEAYNSRGIAYREKGEIDRAIEDLNKAIQLDPQLAEAHSNRGVAYRNKGEVDRAIEDYNKAIELKPKSVEPYNNRGVAYCSKGDYTRAIQDFSKSIELTPILAVPYNNRGTAYCCEGEYDCAIVDLNKAIQLKPDYAEAYCNRGLAYYKKNDFDLAIEDYTKAIELQPKLADAYANRGEVWLRLEEWDKARADLTTASEKGNDIIASFHNEYESVEAYERRNRVKLPEDIATMLTPRRRSRFPKTEKFLDSDGTPLESPDVFNLLAKLRSAGTPLSQYVQTRPTFGLKTGRQDAFVIDSVTRDQLIAEHPSSADILKPFLHGRDIRRWQVARPDSWLIFTCRRIEINRYPAIRKHLEKHRSSLSKRAGKQKWYELPATKSDAEHFTQTKLVCPNSYDHQTFAVDTEGFYCGDTCYLIPTEETWLCGLLNSRAAEWFYSQASNQLTGDYLRARSRYIQETPVPDLTSAQKSLIGKLVDYLIYLQGQPTTSSGDLAHARDFIMLKYFERIIDGLVYEAYLGEELHHGGKQFFKPLLDEGLPQLEEIRGDTMSALREIFERLYERTHPIRRNLFFLDSVKSIRIIEGKA